MEPILIVLLAAGLGFAIAVLAVLVRRATSFEWRVDRRRDERRRFEAAWSRVLQAADDRAAVERGRREQPEAPRAHR